MNYSHSYVLFMLFFFISLPIFDFRSIEKGTFTAGDEPDFKAEPTTSILVSLGEANDSPVPDQPSEEVDKRSNGHLDKIANRDSGAQQPRGSNGEEEEGVPDFKSENPSGALDAAGEDIKGMSMIDEGSKLDNDVEIENTMQSRNLQGDHLNGNEISLSNTGNNLPILDESDDKAAEVQSDLPITFDDSINVDEHEATNNSTYNHQSPDLLMKALSTTGDTESEIETGVNSSTDLIVESTTPTIETMRMDESSTIGKVLEIPDNSNDFMVSINLQSPELHVREPPETGEKEDSQIEIGEQVSSNSTESIEENSTVNIQEMEEDENKTEEASESSADMIVERTSPIIVTIEEKGNDTSSTTEEASEFSEHSNDSIVFDNIEPRALKVGELSTTGKKETRIEVAEQVKNSTPTIQEMRVNETLIKANESEISTNSTEEKTTPIIDTIVNMRNDTSTTTEEATEISEDSNDSIVFNNIESRALKVRKPPTKGNEETQIEIAEKVENSTPTIQEMRVNETLIDENASEISTDSTEEKRAPIIETIEEIRNDTSTTEEASEIAEDNNDPIVFNNIEPELKVRELSTTGNEETQIEIAEQVQNSTPTIQEMRVDEIIIEENASKISTDSTEEKTTPIIETIEEMRNDTSLPMMINKMIHHYVNDTSVEVSEVSNGSAANDSVAQSGDVKIFREISHTELRDDNDDQVSSEDLHNYNSPVMDASTIANDEIKVQNNSIDNNVSSNLKIIGSSPLNVGTVFDRREELSSSFNRTSFSESQVADSGDDNIISNNGGNHNIFDGSQNGLEFQNQNKKDSSKKQFHQSNSTTLWVPFDWGENGLKFQNQNKSGSSRKQFQPSSSTTRWVPFDWKGNGLKFQNKNKSDLSKIQLQQSSSTTRWVPFDWKEDNSKKLNKEHVDSIDNYYQTSGEVSIPCNCTNSIENDQTHKNIKIFNDSTSSELPIVNNIMFSFNLYDLGSQSTPFIQKFLKNTLFLPAQKAYSKNSFGKKNAYNDKKKIVSSYRDGKYAKNSFNTNLSAKFNNNLFNSTSTIKYSDQKGYSKKYFGKKNANANHDQKKTVSLYRDGKYDKNIQGRIYVDHPQKKGQSPFHEFKNVRKNLAKSRRPKSMNGNSAVGLPSNLKYSKKSSYGNKKFHYKKFPNSFNANLSAKFNKLFNSTSTIKYSAQKGYSKKYFGKKNANANHDQKKTVSLYRDGKYAKNIQGRNYFEHLQKKVQSPSHEFKNVSKNY